MFIGALVGSAWTFIGINKYNQWREEREDNYKTVIRWMDEEFVETEKILRQDPSQKTLDYWLDSYDESFEQFLRDRKLSESRKDDLAAHQKINKIRLKLTNAK